MRALSIALASLAAVAIVAIPRAAAAVESYPPAMKSHLFLDYQPPCSICHLAGATEFGTVTTPFGVSMKSRGLTGESNSSLRDALDALAAEGTDSDADGMGDIDELIAGKDPNIADGDIQPQPHYGCSAVPGATRGRLAGFLALVTIVLSRGRGARSTSRAAPEGRASSGRRRAAP